MQVRVDDRSNRRVQQVYLLQLVPTPERKPSPYCPTGRLYPQTWLLHRRRHHRSQRCGYQSRRPRLHPRAVLPRASGKTHLQVIGNGQIEEHIPLEDSLGQTVSRTSILLVHLHLTHINYPQVNMTPQRYLSRLRLHRHGYHHGLEKGWVLEVVLGEEG